MLKAMTLAAALGAGLPGLTLGLAGAAQAQTVSVSRSDFQEERWKTDEAAIVEALKAAGATEIATDAQSSSSKPLSDIENLMVQDLDARIILAPDDKVDAAMASNDGTAGGVAAALTAQGLDGIPVSGQDGDHAALTRIARGAQTVSVWKDARDLGRQAAEIALVLAGGGKMTEIEGSETWISPDGTELTAKFQEPVAITRANLPRVVKAGWINKADLRQGVRNGPAPCG